MDPLALLGCYSPRYAFDHPAMTQMVPAALPIVLDDYYSADEQKMVPLVSPVAQTQDISPDGFLWPLHPHDLCCATRDQWYHLWGLLLYSYMNLSTGDTGALGIHTIKPQIEDPEHHFWQYCLQERSLNTPGSRGGARTPKAVNTDPPTATSSFTDEAMTPASLSSSDNYRQHQELLRKISETLQIPLKEVQVPTHKCLDVLQYTDPSKVALLINKSLLRAFGTH